MEFPTKLQAPLHTVVMQVLNLQSPHDICQKALDLGENPFLGYYFQNLDVTLTTCVDLGNT